MVFLAADWDDDEHFIYWRNWTSTAEQQPEDMGTFPGATMMPEGDSAAAVGLRRRGAFRRRETASKRRGQHVQDTRKETSMRALPLPELPPLEMSRPEPLLSWVSPVSAVSMTTPWNRRTLVPISEDVVLSVASIPEIIVTPPSPVPTGKQKEEPAVTGHDVFEAGAGDMRYAGHAP
ncbi:hypothetical protein ACO1O0_001396 [Amphichorda felina]